MASVDIREIEKYTKRAKVWWDLDGPQMLLHKHTPAIRIPFIVHGLSSTGVIKGIKGNKDNNPKSSLANLKILDVGCGGGITTEPLALMQGVMTGVDPAPALIEVAKNHLKIHENLKIDYFCNSIEGFSTTNKNNFDAVICCEVLEHVSDVRSVLKSSVETLKPGGSIFITTFNKTIFSLIWGIIFMEVICGIIPRGAHKWSMFISPEDVAKILADYGCKTVEVRGAWYSIFTRNWSESSYTGVFYGLHAVKEK
jgi:ubiquinone biosynthesis O-methyltransferase